MPIEDEWGFVLMQEPSAHSMRDLPPPVFIEQGYIGDTGARVRRRTKRTGETSTVFTWKRKLSRGGMMEIEPDISVDDFHLLWSECDRRLVKDRYLLPCIGSGLWELDAFLRPGSDVPVLWKVEVESKPDMPWAPGDPLHPFLLANPFLIVPSETTLYSSFSLSTEEGMKTALQALRNGGRPPAPGLT